MMEHLLARGEICMNCPQHLIPLKIEEKTLSVFGTSYSVIVGKCPKCRNLYINQMLFPACGIFQVSGQTYEFCEELYSLFPPKNPVALKTVSNNPGKKTKAIPSISNKKRRTARRAKGSQERNRKVMERKLKAREAGIREIRERILKGDYTEYHVKTVNFVEKIPVSCDIDGDELVDVKHASFDMYGVKVKAHAYCCIRCNSAYLREDKREEIQEKINDLKKKSAPLPKVTPQNSGLNVSHILYQIPALGISDTRCPFCKKVFDTAVNIKYYSMNDVGQMINKRATLQGCRQCGAVFADRQQMNAIKNDNFKKKVYTISPYNYQNAGAMMEATKLSPQREGEGNQQLPYEDLPGGVENISRENKVVQVYSNKCHCQKCENKYKRVTTVNRTAVVDTIEGKTENINVMFCKGCGQYFVSIVTLDQYKTIYGGLLIECRLPPDLIPNQQSWFDFAPDSVLSRCGYTVKEGVPQEHRQAVLRYILETGKATKYEIIEKINSFISFRETQSKYYGACQRWKEDIKYVNEYMIHHQKKIFGLEFVPAGSLKKK